MPGADSLRDFVAETVEKLDEQPEAHIFSWLWRLGVFGLAIYCNPDLTIIPYLTNYGLSFWYIFTITVLIANTALVYYFHFWGWTSKELAKKTAKKLVESEEFQRDLQFAEKICLDLDKYSIRNRIKVHIWPRLHDFIRKKHKTIQMLKRGGLVSVFFLGCSPITGSRVTTSVFIGVGRLHKGLYALMAGNTVRIFYMTGLWWMVRSLLGSYFKWIFIGFLIVSTIFVLYKALASRFLTKKSPE